MHFSLRCSFWRAYGSYSNQMRSLSPQRHMGPPLSPSARSGVGWKSHMYARHTMVKGKIMQLGTGNRLWGYLFKERASVLFCFVFSFFLSWFLMLSRCLKEYSSHLKFFNRNGFSILSFERQLTHGFWYFHPGNLSDHLKISLGLLCFSRWVVSGSFATPRTVACQAPLPIVSCLGSWILYHWATKEGLL